MTFNDAAVNEIFSNIVSYALETGRFDLVNQHEPTNAPGKGIQFSLWIQNVRPVGAASGTGAVSGVVLFNGRVYSSFRQQPKDSIDPGITSAVADLMNSLTSDFDWGGDVSVRAVDLLGMYGTSLNAEAGYIEIDRQVFRTMTLNIPVIINDLFVMGV